MSRALTDTQRGELHSPQTTTEWLHLVTIDHADLSSPIRLAEYPTDVVSRSNTYTAWPVIAQPPDEDADSLPAGTLSVCVVDRTVLSQLRALPDTPTVTIEVIRLSAPDSVIATWDLDVGSADIVPLLATLELVPEGTFHEAWPGLTYTPEDFPGMFD